MEIQSSPCLSSHRAYYLSHLSVSIHFTSFETAK